MPITVLEHTKSLGQPPLCEQLKVRDIVDDLLVQVNGSFVAGYAVSGINSYYASDEDRNRTKLSLEGLVRSLPERSMRMQARFEITEGTGDLITRYTGIRGFITSLRTCNGKRECAAEVLARWLRSSNFCIRPTEESRMARRSRRHWSVSD